MLCLARLAVSFVTSVCITWCFSNFQPSFGCFISLCVSLCWAKYVCECRQPEAHVTRLVRFSSAPLSVLLFILPSYSCLCFISYLLIFHFVSKFPCTLWNSPCLFLDIIFFNSWFVSGAARLLSLITYNAGENIVVWTLCGNSPFDGGAPNRTVSWGSTVFLTLSPRSRVLGSGVAWLKSQL